VRTWIPRVEASRLPVERDGGGALRPGGMPASTAEVLGMLVVGGSQNEKKASDQER
jgi:hypothetical protein